MSSQCSVRLGLSQPCSTQLCMGARTRNGSGSAVVMCMGCEGVEAAAALEAVDGCVGE